MMDPTSPILPAATTTTPVARPKADGSAKTGAAFEAVFLGQMAQMMMNTVQQGEQFGGGHGEEMFRGVLAEKLGAAMTARGGVGIAPLVMQQIIKMQGGSNGQ